MIWILSHFGLAIIIALIDFAVVFGSTWISTDKFDEEDVFLFGFVVNALGFSVALSLIILGE